MKDLSKAQDAASLFHILDEQAALFQQWLSLEREKKEALQAREPLALESAVKEQAQILAALDRLESSRRNVARRIVGSAGDPVLQEVADALPAELHARCAQSAARLKELMDQVQQANAFGQDLVRHAAAHNQAMLEALVGAGDAPATYRGPVGQTGTSGPPRVHGGQRIDRKA